MELQILTFSEYVHALNEGLIKTYDIDKTIKYMSHQLNLINVEHDFIKNDNNTFDLKLINFRYIDNSIVDDVIKVILINILNSFGWFPSLMEIESLLGSNRKRIYSKEFLLSNKKDIQSVTIRFESKFDKNTIIPDKLYHLTIKEYAKKIEKYGISPKAKSKLTKHDYDDRIYVCSNLEDCKKLINRMKIFYTEEFFNKSYDDKNTKFKKDIEWIIYEIDAKEAKIDKMYDDPNYYGKGYYVLNHINPECLKIADKE